MPKDVKCTDGIDRAKAAILIGKLSYSGLAEAEIIADREEDIIAGAKEHINNKFKKL